MVWDLDMASKKNLVFVGIFVVLIQARLGYAADFSIPATVTVEEPVPVVVTQPVQMVGPLSEPGPLKVEIQSSAEDQAKDQLRVNEQAEREKSDLAAQWLAAKSAERMVTLSWAQFIASIVAVLAAIGSVIIARSTHVAENRPMLVPSVPTFEPEADICRPPKKVTCIAKNEGRGVALITGGRMWTSRYEKGDSLKHPKGTPPATLWPVSHGQVWGSVDVDLGLTDSEIVAVAGGKLELVIHWLITYKSVSKKSYELKCAFRWSAQKGKFEPHIGTMFWKV